MVTRDVGRLGEAQQLNTTISFQFEQGRVDVRNLGLAVQIGFGATVRADLVGIVLYDTGQCSRGMV